MIQEKVDFEKIANSLSISQEEVSEAVRSSPLFLNKLRKRFHMSQLLELVQHRSFIISDLDIVNVHLVKNLKPSDSNKTQLVAYDRLYNETEFLYSYSVSNS